MYKLNNWHKIRRLKFRLGEMGKRLAICPTGSGIPALRKAMERKKKVIKFLQDNPTKFYSWVYLEKRFNFSHTI